MSEHELTTEQLEEVSDFLAEGDYQSAYGVIESATNGTDYNANSWFDHAAAINSGSGPASQFIRTYMDVATALGFGDDNNLTTEQHEQASDLIAESVLNSIIESNGVLPDVQEIIDTDKEVAVDFLGIDPLEWGGDARAT
tara:strand:- start:47 stop:466 length:420 start_codon:yes stop_codon:yes gene_type:complete